MTKTNTKPVLTPTDFYFWLGADGELGSLTPKQFEDKIKEEQELLRKWLNVEDVSSE